MPAPNRKLSHYLKLNYPFIAQVLDDGEYFVTFPNLEGCMTGAPTLEELPGMIREATQGWLESAYDQRVTILMPEPTILQIDEIDVDYSGKFNLRLPRSLHRALADGAERDGVSLNQHVVALLSGAAHDRAIEQRLDAIERRLAEGEPSRRTAVAEERPAYDAPRTSARKPAPARKKSRRGT